MSGNGHVTVRRTVLVRQPAERVWIALRDELPRVATGLRGIETVRRIERSAGDAGVVLTVHEWKAAAALPAGLERYIDPDALSWIERAHWNGPALESRWTVESRILAGGLTGAGTTRLEPAMGGRGSRLHFEISASLAAGALGPLGANRLKSGFEDAAANLIAKTLQDLGVAVDAYLANGSR